MLKPLKNMFNKEVKPDTELDVETIAEIDATPDIREQLDRASAEIDAGYLEYSAEAVGFNNREDQWNLYASVAGLINTGASVLDFGCGRGDFKSFWLSEVDSTLDYTGVDMNQPLIEAGRRIYNDRELILTDWFQLNDDVRADWCINIGSCNLRYDTDTVTNDMEYMQRTVENMYQRANTGVVVTLASSLPGIEDGLINYDPGEVLNWAQSKFGQVALDHTMSRELFNLIIYKQ